MKREPSRAKGYVDVWHLVEVSWSDDDKRFVATSPDFPGCSALGETEAEALSEFQDAAKAWEPSMAKSNPDIVRVANSEGCDLCRPDADISPHDTPAWRANEQLNVEAERLRDQLVDAGAIWGENAERFYTASELKALLNERDDFLVEKGLWAEFTRTLRR